METPSGKLTTGKNEQAVKATVNSLKKAPHVISAVSPLSSEGAGALSKDKRIGYISVTIDLSSSDLTEDQANEIIDAESPARRRDSRLRRAATWARRSPSRRPSRARRSGSRRR